ncbi:hypothetical protein [Hespellia stercorisuis]|uniref:Uncharacterized protein n=1 Tax=Hespellia stercorisuis DSM 15480 TaxID=1121950 RepID=A0A1M6WA39_9FIRM|nr:hypothetical protein [Hespellia stercorisuis]SHK90640.1 hypothetical protein SAMN02745243_03971 [Hespellia stercorisuis DSM 15480]
MRRRYSQIIVILFLFVCSPVLLARAEDTPGEDVQWESASTWEELQVWLLDHESAGGTIKLTQDVVMTGDFIYSRFFSDMTEPGELCIDTGAYHLLVEGNLQFAGGPKFTITGDGEVIRVAEAGRLKMTAIAIENRTGGCAIYQEEGGTLSVGGGTVVQGEIHYAELPVVTDYPYVEVMVPEAGNLTEHLPSTVYAYYNYQGQDNSSEMSVEWDLEAFESQIAGRQRFRLGGHVSGAAQQVPLTAEVVFFDRDITFSETRFYEYQMSTLVSLDYYCRGVREPQLYYSFDQDTYTPVSAHPVLIEEEKGQAQFSLVKGKSLPECAEDEIPWEPGDPAISFVFGWQTESGEQYSDVICYDGTGGVIAGEPYDGNRGGGTDLGGDIPENGGLGDGDKEPILPSPPTQDVPEIEDPDKEEEPGQDDSAGKKEEPGPDELQPPTTILETEPTQDAPDETGGTAVVKKQKADPLVLAGTFGFMPEVIIGRTDNTEGAVKRSGQSENTSQKESANTTGVSQTASASESTSVSGSKTVRQEEFEQDGSKMWMMVFITGTVLLIAFGLSGAILKKIVTVQNPLGELINFCTKQRIFKTCFAILFR